jgi:L-amino acid N-acyltransferase YncA
MSTEKSNLAGENSIRIRTAAREDIPALAQIYNYEVEHGTATLDLHPRDLADRTAWFELHNKDNHPLIVAVTDGAATGNATADGAGTGNAASVEIVVGYASLSPYREKEAYASTVELSIYIHQDYRRRGIATSLMRAILELAKEDERTHLVVSVITSGNEASARLHERFGFTFCGTMRDVGMKFGKYQAIDHYSLVVDKEASPMDSSVTKPVFPLNQSSQLPFLKNTAADPIHHIAP